MRYLLLAFLFFSLSACVAGSDSISSKQEVISIDEALSRVNIKPIKHPNGELLYTALSDALKTEQSSAKALYSLEVTEFEISHSYAHIYGKLAHMATLKASFIIRKAGSNKVLSTPSYDLGNNTNSKASAQDIKDGLFDALMKLFKLHMINVISQQ